MVQEQREGRSVYLWFIQAAGFADGESTKALNRGLSYVQLLYAYLMIKADRLSTRHPRNPKI